MFSFFQRKKPFSAKLKSLQEKVHSFEKQNHDKEVNISAPRSIIQLAESLPKKAVVPVGNIFYRLQIGFFFFLFNFMIFKFMYISDIILL